MTRKIHLLLRRRPAAAVAALSALVACGGGGDGPADPGIAAAIPASGAYAWVLKADGSTNNLRYGLSLVHPASPNTEYVIEPPSAFVTEARLVSSGTVDHIGLVARGLEPYALLYIVGGDVRRVPLQANGSSPVSRVARAQTTSACTIVLTAIDHAQPEQSRFVVSTAGADGICRTADDGRAEVKLDASRGLVFTPLTTELPLGVVRDVATLAPRGWIGARSATLWSPEPVASVVLRATGTPAIDRVVSNSFRDAVVESTSGLSLIDFPGGDVVTQSSVPGITTTGWQGIGFDSSHHYAYRTTGSGATASWQVLRVSRQLPISATVVGGDGELVNAAAGDNLIYLTLVSAVGNQLLAVSKQTMATPQMLESQSTSDLSLVTAGSAGVHQLWRVRGLATASPRYEIEMIDESFTKVHVAGIGAFPLAVVEASEHDFTRHESRSTFLYATGFDTRAFGDATLWAYDASARIATSIGVLPGASLFGADSVFAGAASGPSRFGGGFAARSAGGVVQSSDARVFGFDTTRANSLMLTTGTR